MNIRKSLGMAATTVKANFFNRISTNPNRKDNSSTNYLDLIYERDYKTVRRYRDYREMMQDPQVKIGIQILQMFLLSREMHITPTGDMDVDKQAADALESFLKQDMDTPLRNVRKNIYTALPYGFSAQELVYKLRDDGKIGLKGMYPIHRRTLDHSDAFDFDDNGELVALNQSDVDVIGVNTPIPIEKVLLYSFDCEFDDRRGNSALDEIYDNYYIKKKILKWLAIFLQKHGSPFLVGKTGNNQWKDKLREQLEGVIEGRTQMTIDKDDEVSMIESAKDGSAFFNAISYHDNVMFRRLFIGTLIMGQGDTSGAYSQSQTQVEVMRMLLDGVHEEIAGAMQKVLDQLTDWNFSQASKPKISFEKFEDKDVIALLAALEPYLKDMIIEKGAWLNEIMSTAIKEYANIDVDLDEESTEDAGEYYNPSTIPGDENAPLNNTQIVNDLVSTLPVK